MTLVSLDIVGAITGIVGLIIAIISLSWQIYNSLPRIILKHISFCVIKYDKKEKKVIIKVSIRLRNKGSKVSTIEYLTVRIGSSFTDYTQNPLFTETLIVPGTKTIEFYITLDEEEYREIFLQNNVIFDVVIDHTLDRIRKTARGSLSITGYFNIY